MAPTRTGVSALCPSWRMTMRASPWGAGIALWVPFHHTRFSPATVGWPATTTDSG